MKEFSVNGNKVILGENAKENTELIKEYQLHDSTVYWFHLKDYPSPHLLLVNEYELEKETVVECCKLLKLHSKKEYRFMKNIKINYTNLENVITTKTPGLVQLKGKVNVKTI